MRMRPWAMWLGALGLCAAGCQDVESVEPQVEEAQRALVEGGSALDEREAAARDGWASEQGSEVVIATDDPPTPYLIDVDWSQLEGHAELDPSLVDEDVLKTLGDLPLPVLLPSVPEVAAKLQVSRGEQWYTAFADAGAYAVWMSASRVGFAREEGSGELETESLPEKELMVGRASGIAELSFPMANLVYSITVECAEPLADPRCTEDDFMLELAESLALAGGAR